MRIVAGIHGGRRLAVPRGTGTRPTADRAREGLFSSLQSLLDLDGARVLDLYAGSGALGLEALSRGAAEATLVEREQPALAALRANVTELAVQATVVEADVAAFLAGPPEPFDLVLLDPPYELDADPVLALLVPWLVPGAVVVAERRTRGPEPTVPAGLEPLWHRRYGEATLWYFRAA
ncbi:MAG TPA: 16S rRNA (guanine(966)-N(2))-methyltransferase RsmD [Mycobacteriales bacterium]|nr:16S rRNA (guanine(966)-N(2))-methyltransferase RsmD [Mycobacteriales bacterium]